MNFFENQRNWDLAASVIDSWRGTPYRHLWMKKGRGADCSLFIGAVLQELGVVSRVDFEFYPPDWWAHTQTEAVRDTFAVNIANNMVPGFTLEIVPREAPLARGDIPTFSLLPSGVTNHAGILLDPPTSFVHSIQKRGVSSMDFGRYWRERVAVVYRVVQR